MVKLGEPVHWIGNSKKEREDVLNGARRAIRAALFAAQNGRTVNYAKRMRGDLREAMEIAAANRDGAFRGIYYVGKKLIYALVFFQKKSKRGIETPKRELDLIRHRLAWARRCEREAG